MRLPDLLQIIDGGAAAVMATVAGNAAVEETDHGDHESEHSADHVSSQCHAANHAVNLVSKLWVISPVHQLSEPQSQ